MEKVKGIGNKIKKKIISIFILLLLMIGISPINAEEKTEIKKVGEGENFVVKYNDENQFTVKGISLNIYEENIDTPSSKSFLLNPKTDISDEKAKDDNQIVKVDNTSANKSSIIIFLSIFMIIIGVIVIISTISIKKVEHIIINIKSGGIK